MNHTLDLVTIGRSSVDLYGTQVGGRLEDMRSFDKYIGGSPTNIAAGAARLGLRAALITRVGDEHMGRFMREQLVREGVDVRGVVTDPERMTALVILGIRDDAQFPMVFYREDCADMALEPGDIDETLIAEANVVLVTGTHLSHSRTEAAVLRALDLARKHGAKCVLDIDYRPPLWGLGRMGDGESRYVASDAVTAKLQSVLDRFDLIVGTEEEFHISGGDTDTVAALRAVRAVTDATMVCKRGASGAVVIENVVPDDLDGAISGDGFPIETFNVVGAGDGFCAGLLYGWINGHDWHGTLTYANACGAMAVSRHGCTPAYPSKAELELFLDRGIVTASLRHDTELEQVHWATNRPGRLDRLRVFAFDHRAQIEEMEGYSPAKGAAFKQLCLDAALAVQDGAAGYGILCDDRIGRAALRRAASTSLWVARPTEWPGSRPLTFEPEVGVDAGGLNEWSAGTVVKALCFCHPDDTPEMRAAQETTVHQLFTAARRNRLEFLLELIPSKVAPSDVATLCTLIDRFYDLGVCPDWWKLESQPDHAAWSRVCDTIKARDAHVRGIVLLGLDASETDVINGFRAAAGAPLVKGFAVGRTIFGATARAWMTGNMTDIDARDTMARTFGRLCAAWDEIRPEEQA